MGFGESVKHCFKLYAVFRGRATRAEYWWFTAFAVLIDIALTIVTKYLITSTNLLGAAGTAKAMAAIAPLVGSLLMLALVLPLLAVTVRRFHDVGISGGWYLLALAVFLFAAFQNPRTAIAAYAWIPMLIAVGAMLVVACLPGSRGANRYGAGSAAAITGVFGDDADGAAERT